MIRCLIVFGWKVLGAGKGESVMNLLEQGHRRLTISLARRSSKAGMSNRSSPKSSDQAT